MPLRQSKTPATEDLLVALQDYQLLSNRLAASSEAKVQAQRRAQQMKAKLRLLEKFTEKQSQQGYQLLQKARKIQDRRLFQYQLGSLNEQKRYEDEIAYSIRREKCLNIKESLTMGRASSEMELSKRKGSLLERSRAASLQFRQLKMQAVQETQEQILRQHEIVRTQQLLGRQKLGRYEQFKREQARQNYLRKLEQQRKKHLGKMAELSQLTQLLPPEFKDCASPNRTFFTDRE